VAGVNLIYCYIVSNTSNKQVLQLTVLQLMDVEGDGDCSPSYSFWVSMRLQMREVKSQFVYDLAVC